MTRVCVIGSGYWGPNLARNLDSLPGKPLYGVSDLREERLAYIKHIYPHVAVSQDYRTFLDDEAVNAAVIATPANSHFQLAREFLLRGKHTLVEKPLAMTAAQCRELIHIARQNDRVLMVGHTFEYSPAVARLKEMVQGGELGDIYYIYSNRLNLGGLPILGFPRWNRGPHTCQLVGSGQGPPDDRSREQENGGLRRYQLRGPAPDLRQRRNQEWHSSRCARFRVLWRISVAPAGWGCAHP
ncbi:MAG: Gfo/Idh/MocA family oxidoreductase [Chloroflexi bacterium]|nr:Gfo/Idh/MocA family oxidoreductase [Chloroflexota bacterium]